MKWELSAVGHLTEWKNCGCFAGEGENSREKGTYNIRREATSPLLFYMGRKRIWTQITELLMQIWVKPDEIRNLSSAVLKSLDYEIHMEPEEMRSVLHVVKKMTEEIVSEISEKMV